LVQPSLNPPGGGNLVACWMLEALRDEHQLSVLTWCPPEIDECNRFYGTTLRSDDFELQLAPQVARRLIDLVPLPLRFLKDSLLYRHCKALGADYDLIIATNNEADLGRCGIQYVHFPRLELDRPFPDLRWYNSPRSLASAYINACNRLARYSPQQMTANLTLTNSAWIARRVRALHGVATTVLYPPVPGTFPSVPWEERDDGFVAIGRWSPEKRFGRIIDTIAAVRAAGRKVRLHIIGTPGPPQYTRAVRRRVAENAEWVSLHENLDRDALLQLVARQRYGIHFMPDEHFGIAVAEMIRAGCIVFVPNDGGPAEIVAQHEPLLFASPAEATKKILAVLTDENLSASLRAHLAQRAQLFSCDTFVAQLRDIVRYFWGRSNRAANLTPAGLPSWQDG